MVRRSGVDVGAAAAAVLSAQLPADPARPQLPPILAVQDAVLDIAEFWLDRGVDGFLPSRCGQLLCSRCAAAEQSAVRRQHQPCRATCGIHEFQLQPAARHSNFISRLRGVMGGYGARMTVGELAWLLWSAWPTTRGQEPASYRAYAFDFLSSCAVVRKRWRSIISRWRKAPDDGWPGWAFSNHDTSSASLAPARCGAMRLARRQDSARHPLPFSAAQPARDNLHVRRRRLGLPEGRCR